MYYTVSEAEFMKAADALLKLADGILSDPNKFRKIDVNDEVVKSVLGKIPGGLDCLLEMGYSLKDNFYQMPVKISMGKIMKVKLDLKDYYDQIVLRNSLTNVSEEEATRSRKRALKQTIPRPYSKSELDLFVRLSDNFDRMFLYEEILRIKHLWTGPVEDRTKKRMEQSGLDGRYYKDIFLLELLYWFKYSFFTWVDAPECDCCGQSKLIGYVEPTLEEVVFGAYKTELYKCSECSVEIRFPRYNNPLKLLETRRGRCGEWANCFALICRSVGFETRYILANFDHVWVEVYSESQQRWLHCDPCENVCDQNLLYEKGWGREITYIFAFSLNNIQDVTWKYSSDHKALMRRRKECKESWLVKALITLRQERFKLLRLSPEAENRILNATALELVDMLNEPSEKKDEKYSGRTTGSLEWRIARGEIGSPPTFVPHTITLLPLEKEHETFEIVYNSAKDLYKRFTGSYLEVSNWSSLVYSSENIFRKVEHDWKKVYLSRTPGSQVGSLTWKIDLNLVSRIVRENVLVYVTSTTYNNATVEWTISNEKNIQLNLKPGIKYDLNVFKNSAVLRLDVKLMGGDGENAWQHAQIFRQDFNSTDDAFFVKFRTREVLGDPGQLKF
ncbi:hypothetical protein HELRODRAFT_81998 [Helobdella robusta]|uniref:Peptide-N(4)-(N-acetyl-beta-glucosaminyl)asparagine amidase n=1 Tax=Helobdella robusta TaxID=6412 RepID=T1G4L5_HELRO|nr:hypothetical protein HELRODRAFT_81998 [Helobdella robusta]ESO01416.1 hypothetical protein HELRODRAFT_81998 [Helobdella robusta]